jgi:hypothetical protein
MRSVLFSLLFLIGASSLFAAPGSDPSCEYRYNSVKLMRDGDVVTRHYELTAYCSKPRDPTRISTELPSDFIMTANGQFQPESGKTSETVIVEKSGGYKVQLTRAGICPADPWVRRENNAEINNCSVSFASGYARGQELDPDRWPFSAHWGGVPLTQLRQKLASEYQRNAPPRTGPLPMPTKSGSELTSALPAAIVKAPPKAPVNVVVDMPFGNRQINVTFSLPPQHLPNHALRWDIWGCEAAHTGPTKCMSLTKNEFVITNETTPGNSSIRRGPYGLPSTMIGAGGKPVQVGTVAPCLINAQGRTCAPYQVVPYVQESRQFIRKP